jgi:pimeloyl-ACP methyl ester carboxylesterase
MEPLRYDELANWVARVVPDAPIVVIAESFSGPLAVSLAERRPVAALVFCNTFVVTPRSSALQWLASPLLFRLPMPGFLLRRYVLRADADDTLVREVSDAVAAVPAAVLAFRLRLVLAVDATDTLARCVTPALYLRGTEDRLVPELASDRMVSARRMRIVPVAGPHLLLQANPLGAWQAIVPFLDSLPTV